MTERIQRQPITAITHMPYSFCHADFEVMSFLGLFLHTLSSLSNVVSALFRPLGLRISYNNKKNLDVNVNL